MDDLKLFNGIVSDLFPKIKDAPVDYGEMEHSIRSKSLESGLEDVEGKWVELAHDTHSYVHSRLLYTSYNCTL